MTATRGTRRSVIATLGVSLTVGIVAAMCAATADAATDAAAGSSVARTDVAQLPLLPAGGSTSLNVTAPTRGWDADGKPDLIARKGNGQLYLYRGNGTGGFLAAGQSINAGWGRFDTLLSPGDFSGDGHPDLIGRTPAGDLYLYRGNGAGGFAGPGVKINAGWAGFTRLVTPGDFNGDGVADLIARASNGDLYLYRGNGAGGFAGKGTRIGAGWNAFSRIFSPGDFDGDGHADLLARDRTGNLWLYRGNGAGGFAAPGKKFNAGWNAFNQLLSAGDWNGDGHSDVIARKAGGQLYLYRGNGTGGFSGFSQIGSGWDVFNTIVGVS